MEPIDQEEIYQYLTNVVYGDKLPASVPAIRYKTGNENHEWDYVNDETIKAFYSQLSNEEKIKLHIQEQTRIQKKTYRILIFIFLIVLIFASFILYGVVKNI